jgi:hypothetical protein
LRSFKALSNLAKACEKSIYLLLSMGVRQECPHNRAVSAKASSRQCLHKNPPLKHGLLDIAGFLKTIEPEGRNRRGECGGKLPSLSLQGPIHERRTGS